MSHNRIAKQKSKFAANQSKKGEINLCFPDTEHTLEEGLFALKLDYRALLIVRSDTRNKVDDQRTTCL